MIGNAIANEITKVSKTSPQNSSETVESQTENKRCDREILKKNYIHLKKKRHKIIDDLRLIKNLVTEYEKVKKHFDNTPNETSKFTTKSWVEINGDSHRTYNTNNKIKLKTSMLKSSLCNYSDTIYLQEQSQI